MSICWFLAAIDEKIITNSFVCKYLGLYECFCEMPKWQESQNSVHQNSLKHTIGSHHEVAVGRLLVEATTALAMEGTMATATAVTAVAMAVMVAATATATATAAMVGAMATAMEGVTRTRWRQWQWQWKSRWRQRQQRRQKLEQWRRRWTAQRQRNSDDGDSDGRHDGNNICNGSDGLRDNGDDGRRDGDAMATTAMAMECTTVSATVTAEMVDATAMAVVGATAPQWQCWQR